MRLDDLRLIEKQRQYHSRLVDFRLAVSRSLLEAVKLGREMSSAPPWPRGQS